MIFVSYAELCRDVVAWSEQLPRDIDCIVGVPRSGMLPATILALHRNIPLADVGTFAQGKVFEGGVRDQRRSYANVLVVDDSTLSGKSLLRASEKLKHLEGFKIFYGAVYAKPASPNCFSYRQVMLPRIFEWNMFHSYWTQRCCMDIDGVLCRDPTREENDDGLRYRKFLHTVEPRHLPTVQVHTLVTSRLEQYRIDTVKWLHKHNILYKNLIMHPAASKKERMKAKDHAKRKAHAYRQSGNRLFIESDTHQAKDIRRLTHLPVLCTDTMKLHA
jgi:uncharacterized HAD superfamily protein